jgi:hypothetical protein
MNTPQGVQYLDANSQLSFDADNKAIRKLSQFIPDSFLDRLKNKRHATTNTPEGEMMHVASIPVAIVEKWMAEGFNIYDQNVRLKDIVRRLQREDMTGLMATNKSVI